MGEGDGAADHTVTASSLCEEPSNGGTAGGDAALPLIAAERYEIHGEHGRGGIGVVFDATDLSLQRRVAIKELQASGRRSQARFVREALITARLAHPGIVPIYEAGTWPDGRTAYVMKLVEGNSLRDLLRDCKSAGERLALLPHVIAVADAVAYAHDKGVIHRDLKPANVIVGAFGETVVIDWGLAKDLRAAPGDDPTSQASVGDDELTQTGSVMGTPAYMAPEQLAGAEVDQRSDVYALGMMLRDLIAADTPPGSKSPTQRRLVAPDAERPLRELELAADRAPKELVAIARRALAIDPDDRYRDAGELADELRRFERGQLISAHDYSAWELARRWIARHRGRLALAGTIAVAVSAAVVGYRARGDARPTCASPARAFAGIWDDHVQAVLRAAFDATGTPFADRSFAANAARLDRYVADWRSMYEQSCRATHWEGSQSPELLDLRSQCLDDRRSELRALTARLVAPGASPADDAAANAVEQLVPVDYCGDPVSLRANAPPPAGADSDARRAQLREALGEARAQRLTGDYAGAVERILGVLPGAEHEPHLAAQLQLELGTAHAQLAQDQPAIAAFEAAYLAALRRNDPRVLLQAGAGLVEIFARNGRFREADHRMQELAVRIDVATEAQLKVRGLRALGELAMARGKLGHAADLFQRAMEESGDDGPPIERAESMLSLGAVILAGDLQRSPDHEHYLTRAHELLRAELGAEHPRTLRALVEQRTEPAVRRALEIDDRLGVLPVRTRLLALSVLARLLARAHAFEEAAAVIERARSLAEERLGPASPELAEILNMIGSASYRQGKLETTLAVGRERLAMLEQIFGADHPRVAGAHNNVGLALKELGQPVEAMRHYEQALRIYAHEPTGHHSARGNTLNNMAGIHQHAGDMDAAIELYLQSAAQRELAHGPESADLGDSYTNLGNLLREEKRYDEAARYQRQALAIYETAHAEYRGKAGHEHPDLAWPVTALGEIALEQGRAAEAVPLLERAEQIRREAKVAPRHLGRTQFALARAVWAATRDRARVERLLDAAAATYRGDETDAGREQLHAIATWRRAALERRTAVGR